LIVHAWDLFCQLCHIERHEKMAVLVRRLHATLGQLTIDDLLALHENSDPGDPGRIR
jgi:hypothetical protein